jgi:FAD/FMN-containing dehydrogenase
VITEMTLRLRARPEMERSIAVTLEGDAARRCDEAGRWLRTVPFRPLAAELCAPALSERLGLGARTVLLVRLGGNEALVRAAVGAVEQLGAAEHVDGAIWERLRSAEPAEAAVVRLGTLPASVGTLWASAGRVVASTGGWMHATLARGVVRCVVPATRSREENEWLRSIMKELHAPGSRIVERLPEALWPEVPPATADPLSKSVRRTFDPDRVLNPGILDPNA